MTTAPAPGARRTLARDADTAAEESFAGDGWQIRVRQLLRARAIAASARAKQLLLAGATAAIDTGIAFLQQLRKRTGGAEDRDDRRDRDPRRPGKRATTARRSGEPAAEEAIAPKPRRRLRSLLVYLGVMLAGSMGGMALAYDLLAQLLDHRSAEIASEEVKLSKYSKSVVELKKKLDQQRGRQIEAETHLAAVLAANEKKTGELQAQRAEAEERLASALAGHSGNAQPQEATGRGDRNARGGPGGWTGAGDCTLGSGDVRSVLKGCIANMNRN